MSLLARNHRSLAPQFRRTGAASALWQAAAVPDTPIEPLQRLASMPPGSQHVLVVAAVGVGILYCFLGYKTLKFLIGFTGFLLAGAVAGVIAGFLTKGDPLIMGICAVIGGGCGAAALFFLYRTGIFIIGAMAIGLIAHQVLSLQQVDWAIWGVLGSAFLGGAIALLLERPVMTLATAALGAWLAVCGIAYFLIGPEVLITLSEPIALDRNRGIMVFCWAVLALAGTLAQIATHRGRKRDSED